MCSVYASLQLCSADNNEELEEGTLTHCLETCTPVTKDFIRTQQDSMRKGEEGLGEVRKFRKNRKSSKNFSCYVKRLSNKYGKNSKNNKFHKILHLEREKVKKGFSKSANFAKIAKEQKFFMICEKIEQQIWQK
ncbi:unnamed protein product [Porites evermanni]|uniref:Uncharacterized protein n=1 Tax=Porites evermanni TaxID=104178 RepID=A0ABN8MHM0_9CNID|nr:unnamed protein product [Porites evermanni]